MFFPAPFPSLHFQLTPLRCTRWPFYHSSTLCYTCKKVCGLQRWGYLLRSVSLSSGWRSCCLEQWCPGHHSQGCPVSGSQGAHPTLDHSFLWATLHPSPGPLRYLQVLSSSLISLLCLHSSPRPSYMGTFLICSLICAISAPRSSPFQEKEPHSALVTPEKGESYSVI